MHIKFSVTLILLLHNLTLGNWETQLGYLLETAQILIFNRGSFSFKKRPSFFCLLIDFQTWSEHAHFKLSYNVRHIIVSLFSRSSLWDILSFSLLFPTPRGRALFSCHDDLILSKYRIGLSSWWHGN